MSLHLALNQPDWNTLGIFAVAFMAVVFLPRFWSAAASKARAEQMQKTIDAYRGRVEALEPQVESLQAEVKDCRDMATRWEARYHEQSKYTAQEALGEVLAELVATRKVFSTSMEGLGELITEHSRLVATALDKLDRSPGA